LVPPEQDIVYIKNINKIKNRRNTMRILETLRTTSLHSLSTLVPCSHSVSPVLSSGLTGSLLPTGLVRCLRHSGIKIPS